MEAAEASLLLSDMVTACELSDAAGVDATQRSWLRSILGLLSRHAASQFGNEVSNARDVPGYLRISTPVGEVLTPFHLAQFVSLIDFRVLKELAEQIRISPETTICLSGSNTFNLRSVGDIDFCEYTSVSGNRIPKSFFYYRDDSEKSSLIEVIHDEHHACAPLDEANSLICSTDSGAVDSKCACDKKSWYMKFIKQIKRGEYLPVSNMIVPEGEEAREYSWAYQEALFPAILQPGISPLPS